MSAYDPAQVSLASDFSTSEALSMWLMSDFEAMLFIVIVALMVMVG